MKKMEHCDTEGSPFRISRLSNPFGGQHWAEAAGCPADPRAFETWLAQAPAFSHCLATRATIPSVRTTFRFSPNCPSSKQTLPFITICAKSHSSATQSREDRFPGGEGRRQGMWFSGCWLVTAWIIQGRECPQCLAQCLTESRHSVNIYWPSECRQAWMSEQINTWG